MNLLARHKNGTTYLKPDGKRQLVLGGALNRFDQESGLYLPVSLRADLAQEQGGGWKLLPFGPMPIAYNATIGRVRYYPVPGAMGKHIEIGDIMPPTAFTVNQINDTCMELGLAYADHVKRILIYDLGIRTFIDLPEGYTGTDTFEWYFDVTGLSQVGSDIFDGQEKVLTLPTPVLWDSAEFPTLREVGAIYGNSVLTLVADLTGLTGAVTIDPSIGITGETESTYGADGADANTNYSVNIYTAVGTATTQWLHSWLLWDMSALPATGVIINSASANFVLYSQAYSYQLHTYVMERMLRHDYKDSTATWNIYKAGTPWSTPGGVGAGDTNSSNRITKASTPAGTWTGLGPMIQDQYDETANTYMGMSMYVNSWPTHPGFQGYITMYNYRAVTPSNRPTLTIEYTNAMTDAVGMGMANGLQIMSLHIGGALEN